jgi:hypothetical protein
MRATSNNITITHHLECSVDEIPKSMTPITVEENPNLDNDLLLVCTRGGKASYPPSSPGSEAVQEGSRSWGTAADSQLEMGGKRGLARYRKNGRMNEMMRDCGKR